MLEALALFGAIDNGPVVDESHGSSRFRPAEPPFHMSATVTEVLDAATNSRRQQRFRPYWTATESAYCLENDSGLLTSFVSQVQHELQLLRYHESELIRVGTALHEALHNAMLHGNLELNSCLRDDGSNAYYELAEQRRRQEPYCHRRIQVTIRQSLREARFVIRDEGPGFDVAGLDCDPTRPENLDRPSGRGLFLIRHFMDQVGFNASGNEITMTFCRRRFPGNQGGE